MKAASPVRAAAGWPTIAFAAAVGGLVFALLFNSVLPLSVQLTLGVSIATVIAWALDIAPEWQVGVASVAALWLVGAIGAGDIAAAATDDLFLLLIAAYVIAFVVERSGLLGTLAARLLSMPMTFSKLCWRLGAIVGLTAFVIPSTSARAAMMLPIYRALLTSVGDEAMRRILALLIPTGVLLSAGGVLTGAAAHILALDIIAESSGQAISYSEWLALAASVALFSSAAAVWLVLRLIAGRDRCRHIVKPRDGAGPEFDRSATIMLVVIVSTLLIWMTSGWHGASIALVGAGASVLVVLLDHARQPISAQALLGAVDWKNLCLLLSTILLAKALIASAALAPLTAWVSASVISVGETKSALTVCLLAAIAMLAHLIVPSRSARAAVLLPALVLPLANSGLDVAVLSLVVVLGTGFCQLVPYGAKPLMIFASESGSAQFRKDLQRLGSPLAAVCWVILVASALLLWPALGSSDIGQRE